MIETLPTPGNAGANPIKVHLEHQKKLVMSSMESLTMVVGIAYREDIPVLASR